MTANYTVPPIIGQLKLNNGRVATFYETDRAGYERALASGATIVEPPPNTAQGEFPSFYRYVGPSPSGGYYYNDPKTNQILDLPAAPTPDQQQSYEATNPRAGTIGQTQAPPEIATPQTTLGGPSTSSAVPAQAPYASPPSSSPGVGAGTTGNTNTSVSPDDNTKTTGRTSQFAVNTSTAALNEFIPTQPNQLDQYASYTYGLSWYLLSREQYNDMVKTGKPNTAGWKLLMQSGGAAMEGRSQAFSLDYYMDDLEITSNILGGATRQAHSALEIKFKVTEPNGITLIESLYNAVQSLYKNQSSNKTQAPDLIGESYAVPGTVAKTNNTVNYLQAHHCMVIRFYGYDKDGNLVAPAKGAFSTNSASGGFGQNAVITKYYPFLLRDLKFAIANRAIEYSIVGTPQAHRQGFTTDRGTVVNPFTMTGQTVEQLLNGPSITRNVSTVSPDDGRKDTVSPGQSVNDTTVNAGVDANGNFTGETQNPNAVVAP